MTLLKLRDYQEECIADFDARVAAGDTRIPTVMATGLGKTVVFAHLIVQWLRLNPGKRAMVLVHTDELVQQAYRKIRDTAPHLLIGIVKAERNEVAAHVIVASVQSLRNKKRRDMIKRVGLIIVDECHHATATTYRNILTHYGVLPSTSVRMDADVTQLPEVKLVPIVAGFTATLARSDKQKLSDIWQACTFERGIPFGIRRGYLLDVRGKRIVIPDMELKNVKNSGGDFRDGSLAKELDRSLAPSIVADAYVEHALLRKGIGFSPTVESAHHFAEAFEAVGISSAVVSDRTPREERRLILKKLHTGEVQVVWNCAVLTEGFDEPTVSCIINGRPTKSAPLYQQMVGRGLRPDLTLPPDQRGDCLVLDVVGTSKDHSLRTLIDLSERPLVEVQDDDLSLLEMEDALDEQEKEAAEDTGIEVEEYAGLTVVEDFDPLQRTGIGAWIQTKGGTYFLPVGKDVYLLIIESEDEPGRFDVAWLTQSPHGFMHMRCPGMQAYVTASRACRCGMNHQGGQGDITEHRALPLDMAVSWAEEVLEELGGAAALLLAGLKNRWRKGEPSEAQLAQCRRLGIEVPGTIDRETGLGEVLVNKGEVADLISTALGSKRIDPVVSFMTAMREEMK